MTSPPTTTAMENTKFHFPLLLVLIAAGLAGNYFCFPIFLNIDFLFGSIFAMLALQFLGLGRGIIAAACIASYTYLLWSHPYAIIIMTVEVAGVGWLMGRRKMGMVLADTLYWLLIGMPLAYFFYRLVMHVPVSSTYIIMTKQAMNGIANALIARLIFTAFVLRSRTTPMPYSEVVYNLLAFFVLCPTLLILAASSRSDFAETDRQIRSRLLKESEHLSRSLQTWVLNRKHSILNLAEMAATSSPPEMQPRLEQAHQGDINFSLVALLDKEATTTAVSPLIDELGESSLGKNFADRPYLPQLNQKLKPMLSEVAMSRIGNPRPVVRMVVPVIMGGEYAGYISAILKLDQLREQLDSNLAEYASLYTLLDKNGQVILTNRPDQKVMTPFVRGKGKLSRLDEDISQWVPVLPPNTPNFEKWTKSLYVSETTIGDLAEWTLILEQPVAPYQKVLNDKYTGKLVLLFLLLLGALALAELLSRKSVVTLNRLGMLTKALPVTLVNEGKDIVWPQSGIQETAQLIDNFQGMTDALSVQFHKVQQINAALEQRVEERTAELQASKQFLSEKNEALQAIEGELRDQLAQYDIVQTKLQEARTVAESSNVAKSQFLANMSHEIRTPMSGILGMTQLLEMTELTQEQREYTAALNVSGKNLMALINDILDLSKIEAGKMKIESSEFSLKQCINDIILMQKSVVIGKGLKLELNIASNLPPLLIGDQLRIKQIILNLLGNAIKFTAQGSISISAQFLENHAPSTLIEIVVRDTGIGIAAESLESIFHPFIQEDGSTSRRYGGTGLGLTISRRLAELMGGTISVVSTQGVGSCFTVTLPFTLSRETTIKEEVPCNPTHEWGGRPLRILYVEDDQINIIFATALFKKLGHDFVVVNNGRGCLAALQDGSFDLVLMDIQMPVMNGKETLLEIRRKEQASGLRQPVIAVTAHAMCGDKAGFLQEGFDGYVAKPLMTSALLAEMKRVVRIETETDHG